MGQWCRVSERFAGGITSVLTEPSTSETWSGGSGAGGLVLVAFHSWVVLLGLPGVELIFGWNTPLVYENTRAASEYF